MLTIELDQKGLLKKQSRKSEAIGQIRSTPHKHRSQVYRRVGKRETILELAGGLGKYGRLGLTGTHRIRRRFAASMQSAIQVRGKSCVVRLCCTLLTLCP